MAGYPRSKHSLTLARADGLAGRQVGDFWVMEFADGCHALFVPLGQGEPEPVAAEFAELDQRRSRVLGALESLLAREGVALKRCGSGHWLWQAGALQGGLKVGSELTGRLQRGSDVEALVDLLRHSGLVPPEPEEVNRLLESPQPFREVAWQDEPEPLLGSGVLSLDCRVLDDTNWRPASSEEVLQGLFPDRDSPAQQMVAQVIEQLGRHRFSIDVESPGVAQLDFDDRLDSYRLNPRGRRLRELAGKPRDVEHLVEQFQLLNRARQEALELFQQALGQQGLYLDARCDPWWVGSDHHQFSFAVGEALTRALGQHTPREVVQRWLDDNGLAWGAGLVEKRSLPPGPILFPELDAEWGALSTGLIEAAYGQVLQGPEEPLYGQRSPSWLWLEPEWRPVLQQFWPQLDEPGWRNLARRAWQQQDESAAQLLLLAGENEPRETLLAALEAEGWTEAYSRETLWMLAEHLDIPLEDDPPVEGPGLWLPPPPLARSAAMAVRSALALGGEAVVAAAAAVPARVLQDWLRAEELEALHRHLASLSDYGCLWELLRVVGNFGWTDLAQQWSEDAGFLSALLADQAGSYGQCALRLRYAGLSDLSKQVATLSLVSPPPSCDDVEPQWRETVRAALEGAWRFDRLAAALAYLA